MLIIPFFFCFKIDVCPDIAIDYMDLVVLFVSVVYAQANLPQEKKAVVLAYSRAHTIVKGVADLNTLKYD